MEKKKVLFLTVAFDTGGTEKVTLDIINNLNPEKYDITLMTMYNGGLYQSQLKSYIKQKYFFPKFIRYVIRYVSFFPASIVYRTFIREKYDIEIACGDDLPSRIINHSPNKKSKKIAWIHMDVIQRGYKGYEMKTKIGRRRFYKNFDCIVNVSKECREKFIKKFGYKEKSIVIYNPIPENEIREKSKEAVNNIFDVNQFNIVCIGRLTDQKGFDRLLEAEYRLSKLKDVKPHHIYIIGEGVEKPNLIKIISDYNLKNVTMLGFQDNPYKFLNQADLFLLSSRDESFSLVVAEAMTLGVPILSTKCTGPNELLNYGNRGCLVENSVDGIYSGLKNILSNDIYYRELIDIAKENQSVFNLNSQISEIEKVLDEVS